MSVETQPKTISRTEFLDFFVSHERAHQWAAGLWTSLAKAHIRLSTYTDPYGKLPKGLFVEVEGHRSSSVADKELDLGALSTLVSVEYPNSTPWNGGPHVRGIGPITHEACTMLLQELGVEIPDELTSVADAS